MPGLHGFSHISLSVRDREVSQQWYCDVFGFELFEQLGKVAQREELDRWAARLAERGVVHSPIADMPYGSVLCLRDPDQIQLEIFYRPGH